MSDDLVKRLRTMDGDRMSIKTIDEAADRIEQLAATKEELEKACKEWAEVSQCNYQRAKAAEEVLEEVRGIVLGANFAKTRYERAWRYYTGEDKT